MLYMLEKSSKRKTSSLTVMRSPVETFYFYSVCNILNELAMFSTTKPINRAECIYSAHGGSLDRA